jgi:hypothetical protein
MGTMIRGLLIIASEHLASARALAEMPPFSLSADESARLFVPAGSQNGDHPAERWWASGLFTGDQFAALQQLAATLPWAECLAYDLATQPDFPLQSLAGMGLKPVNQPMVP